MILRSEWVKTIVEAQALVVIARKTRAAARNHRHTAVLRRALDKLMGSGRPAPAERPQA
jgi:hypothetical protein